MQNSYGNRQAVAVADHAGTGPRGQQLNAGLVAALIALTCMVFSSTPGLIAALDDLSVSLPGTHVASSPAKKAPPAHAFRAGRDGTYLWTNKAAGLSGSVTSTGLAVKSSPSASEVTLRSLALGRAGAMKTLAAATPTATDETAALRHANVIEWFQNRTGSLEQGWTIPARPAGAGKLSLSLAITGAEVRKASNGLTLLPAKGRAISYQNLLVRDARGKKLPAHFTITGTGARIVVDDARAKYPVVIDPDISSSGRLDPPTSAQGNGMGSDIAVNGRWMAIKEPGAQLDPTSTTRLGRLGVYFDQNGAGTWQRVAYLTAAPGNITTQGIQLLVEPAGVTVIAVATGGFRTWTFSGDPITQAPNASPVVGQTLAGVAQPGMALGAISSIAADGDYVVVGMPQTGASGVFAPDGPDAGTAPDPVNEREGAVQIFKRAGGFGTNYAFSVNINPPGGADQAAANRDAGQLFGQSVALDMANGLLAVGATGDDGVQTAAGGTVAAPANPGTSSNTGAVRVYKFGGGTTWTMTQRLAPATGVSGEGLGGSVTFAGSTGGVLAGANGSTIPSTSVAGGAYLWDWNGASAWSFVQRVNADDPGTPANEGTSASNFFGTDVASNPSGTRLFVGATSPAGGTGKNGDVIVFSRAAGSGAVTATQAIYPPTASDQHGGLGQAFGGALATNASQLVVGAASYGNANETLAGRASVFIQSGSTYSLSSELSPQSVDQANLYGYRIAQDGDLLAVSLPGSQRGSSFGLGAVAVYTRNPGGPWTFDQMLFPYSNVTTTSDGGGWGVHLAVHEYKDAQGHDIGAVVAVGDYADDNIDADGNGANAASIITNAGTVSLFGRDSGPGGTWTAGYKLWAGGRTGTTASPGNTSSVEANGLFGASVAFTPDGTLYVGEPGAAGNTGAVHRFDRASTFATWGWKEEITAGSPASTSFGQAVATSGTDVAVSGALTSTGTTIVRRYVDGNTTTNLAANGSFVVGMASDGLPFGTGYVSALDIVGNRVAVGQMNLQEVRVYRMVGGTAVQEAVLDGAGTNTQFGYDLAFNHGGSQTTLIVGAAGETPSGTAHVYVAKVKSDGSGTWSEYGTLTQPSPTSGNGFGLAVTNWPANGGALIGAPGTPRGTTAQVGAVHQYDMSGVTPPVGPQPFVDVSLAPTVHVGANSLKVNGLPQSLLANNATTDGAVAATPIGSIDLSQAPRGTAVSASPMSSIPMSSIPMSSIPMSSIPLSSIPLSGTPGGWEALLSGTAFAGLPLQSVTLQDVYSLPGVQALTLGQLSLAGSPMSSIPMSSIALGATPLSSIPLDKNSSDPAVKQWCDALKAAKADTTALGMDCDHPDASHNADVTVLSIGVKGAPMSSIPMSSIPMSSIPMSSIPMSSIPMSSITLAGTPMSSIPMSSITLAGTPMSSIPMSSIPMSSIPMSSIPMSSITLGGTPMSSIPMSSINVADTPMSSIPMSSIPMSSIPMSSIPMSSIPMSSIPMSSIPMSSITINGTPMSSIPMSSIPMSSIPMSSIRLSDLSAAQRSNLVDCTQVDCAAATLGEAVAAGALKAGGTLGDLDGHLHGVRWSVLIGAGGITTGQLRSALGSRTLADLIGNFDDLTFGELSAVWPYLTLGQIQAQLGGVRLSDVAEHLKEFTAAQVLQALTDSNLKLAQLTGWDTVTLGQVTTLLQYLHLSDLSASLGKLRLGDLVGVIAKTGGGTYSEAELRSALTQADPNAKLGDVQDFGNLTLGELGQYGDLTLGQLFGALTNTEAGKITLGDVLLALINPKQFPWDSLDLSQITTQAFDTSPTGTPVTVAYRADAPDGLPRTVEVTVQVPHGSRIEPGSTTGDGSAAERKATMEGDTATWTFDDVPAGALRQLQFTMDAPVAIGPAQVKATASLPADDATTSDTASTVIQEAFEPNDTLASATALDDDTITLSHISHAGDVDVYKFDVSQPGTRVSISLSNLDADLDATLYSPREGTIVATSGKSLAPVDDTGGSGVPGATQSGTVDAQATRGDDVEKPSDLGNLAAIQGSYNRSRANEQIDTGLLTRTGTYYLAVTGYNGAVDTQPYSLRLKRFVSNVQPSCPARSVTAGTLGTQLPGTLPSGTNTVFVVSPSRMAGLYGTAASDALMNQLNDFITWANGDDSLGIKASVLTVDADQGVRNAYAAWDASPCLPSGANGVASEVARILNGYRAGGAVLKNVVIVGGDDAVPFARVPDRTKVANESGYASTFADHGNALFATFATSSVQSDNPYVDRSPYAFGDRTLYVPDAVVGRMVESPTEIGDQLTDFRNAEGKLAVGTGLVTGYDFLSDGANAIKGDVSSTYANVNSSLISDTWTRADLEDAIHTLKPNLLSVNAHFDHFRALPGAGNTTHDETDLFQAAAVRGALNGDLAGSVVFSMGCHSGLSASDKLFANDDDRALDFAQAVSSQGGVFVGNTGFGYGDTDTVALSEQLMANFAKRLDGSMSVGEALLYAKNAYFSGLAEFTPYDEKVLEETTFYGLPFYRLDVPNPPSHPAPVSPVLAPDASTGLQATTTHLAPTYVTRTADDGTTYAAVVDPATGDDSLTTVQNRPVEPKVDQEYALPAGLSAHDGLVLGITSVDTSNADPYVFQPTVDNADERSGVGVDTAFPTRAVRVNSGLTPAGETFHVAATTGYFRTTSPDGKGLQRTYKSMDVLTYLPSAGNDDFVAPTFSQVTGSVHDGVLSVSAHALDDRGDESRIKRVRLLLLQDPRDGVATTWRGLDLVRTANSDEWTGSLASSGRNLEFILQAVDAAGNVGVTTDKAQNFSNDAAVIGAVNDPTDTGGGGTVGNLELSLSGQQGQNSWYTGPVTVTATGGVRLVYEVVGESGPTGYQEPFQVTGTGLHTVRVTSADGQTQQVTIAIDTVGPVATLTSPAPGQSMPAAPGALISYSCPDAGSGATTCSATVDGNTVLNGSTLPLPPGTHTVVVSAGPDLAGNPASVPTLVRQFTVLGAPATVGAIGVSKAQDGAVTTLTIPFTGYSALTYSGSVAWGDGGSTNCAMAGSGCTITRNAAGGGTLTVTHTYNTAWVDTNATVTVIDNLGQTASATVKVNKKTTLTATAALLQLKVTTNVVELKSGAISATLKDGSGNPLAGQTIKFTFAGGSSICTATTNASGVATCPSNLLYTVAMILAGHYTATFPGRDAYHGSTASASLIG